MKILFAFRKKIETKSGCEFIAKRNIPAPKKRREVTSTYYDNQLILPTAYATQSNLRKRVSSVTYEDKFDNDSLTYQRNFLF
ncbi:MAG: hypothetical protein ACJ77K_06585 [Bacteroidia bacterium]